MKKNNILSLLFFSIATSTALFAMEGGEPMTEEQGTELKERLALAPETVDSIEKKIREKSKQLTKTFKKFHQVDQSPGISFQDRGQAKKMLKKKIIEISQEIEMLKSQKEKLLSKEE